MGTPSVLIDDLGPVRHIAIHRPDKLNALNAATIATLTETFEAAQADPAVRVMVLTGTGTKAFVAGADISEMARMGAMAGRDFGLRGQALMRTIETCTKPVIARINGFALGGGLELAMACHLRVASENARLGQPEINLGLIPGFGGTQRLLRLAGRAATLELCLLGAPITASRALQLGVINEVVPVDELDARVTAISQQLAASAPLALRGILEAVIHGGECALSEGLQFEGAQFGLMFATEDMREGTAAFLDKRKPQFAGR